jgi:undecaprenyl diphosphate synthase
MNKLNHVAFIMDGNGRWGKKRKKGRNHGHLNGVRTVSKIVKASIKFNIPIITFYVFSTENWKRPKKEITFLFNLIKTYFNKEIDNIIKNDIKINVIGKMSNLPSNVKTVLKETIKKTKKNKKILVNIALNYGSKSELVDSIKKIKFKSSVTINNINKNLYTKGLPDPDILIRTGGQKRLSNFMLWQLAYTELYFLDKLWPDFNNIDLKQIINNYINIKRNYGNI